MLTGKTCFAEGLNPPPSIDNSPYTAIHPFLSFFRIPLFWQDFRQYRTMKYGINTKNKLIRQSYFFIFRRLKSNVTRFFIKNTSQATLGRDLIRNYNNLRLSREVNFLMKTC